MAYAGSPQQWDIAWKAAIARNGKMCGDARMVVSVSDSHWPELLLSHRWVSALSDTRQVRGAHSPCTNWVIHAPK